MSSGNRRGSILIITLWLIGILALLSVALAHRLSIELRLVQAQIGTAKARALARGGVRYAMAVLTQDRLADDRAAQQTEDAGDWLGDEWAWNQAEDDAGRDGRVAVLRAPTRPGDEAPVDEIEIRVSDEQGKLSLQRLSAPGLEEVFLALLGRPELYQAVVDYIDGPDERELSTPDYAPKNAPIAVLEEVLGIPGIADEPEVYRRLLRTVSPHVPAAGALNINTADPETLHALFDPVPAEGARRLADAIVDFRWDPGDGETDTGNRFVTLSPFKTEGAGAFDDAARDVLLTMQDLLTTRSSIYRINITARPASGAGAYQLEAVVDRAGDEQHPGPKIVAWMER